MLSPSLDLVTPLPAGTRLLHVGPHKTGTATLQGAFHAGRAELREQGVRYAGRTRQAIEAAHAVTSLAWQNAAGRTPSMRAWQALVDEVAGAPEARVVMSSESFSNADAGQVRRIARDLDPSRLHVVVTLRPLTRVLPSRWQQSVQDGITSSFETWLEGILAAAQSAESGFWRCQRHDQLVARWAEAIGPERVTAVVVDEADHRFVLDAFERLLALRPGTLQVQGDATNRSLTLPEVEAVRAFNLAFVESGLGSALASPLHGRVMRRGAAASMKLRPPADGEPRVELPAWSLAPIATIEAEIFAGLGDAGVHIIGELERLLAAPPRPGGDAIDAAGAPAPVCIPPSAAAALALGVLTVTGKVRGRAGRGWPIGDDAPHVGSFTGYQLAGTLGGRLWNRALGLVEAVTWKGAPTTDHLDRALEWPRTWLAAPTTDCVPAADVARAALDVLVATRYLRPAGRSPDGGPRLRRAGRRWAEPPELARISNLGLLRVLVRRAIRGARRRLAARGPAGEPR